MGGGLLSSAVQVLLKAGILLPSGSHSMAAEIQHAVCAVVCTVSIKASQVYCL